MHEQLLTGFNAGIVKNAGQAGCIKDAGDKWENSRIGRCSVSAGYSSFIWVSTRCLSLVQIGDKNTLIECFSRENLCFIKHRNQLRKILPFRKKIQN
jgi:hypothetical protein